MDAILIIITIVSITSLFISIWAFIQIGSLATWSEQVVNLLSRTFKEYYKSEDIQPVAVNWGIDLIWKPTEGEGDQKRGFITVFYGEDSGIDTPLKDVNEADELSSLFIPVIEKYLHDKALKGER